MHIIATVGCTGDRRLGMRPAAVRTSNTIVWRAAITACACGAYSSVVVVVVGNVTVVVVLVVVVVVVAGVVAGVGVGGKVITVAVIISIRVVK